MSHDAGTGQVLLTPLQDEPSANSSGNLAGSNLEASSAVLPVESYADRLMDDLFDDVEQMLGGGNKPAPDPDMALAGASSASGKDFPLLGMSLVQSSSPDSPPEYLPGSLYDQRSIEQSGDQRLNVPDSQASPSGPMALLSAGKSRRSSQSYDRFLLGIGCVSLLLTLAVWLLYQEANRPTPAPVASTPDAENVSGASHASNEIDQPFADYVQRSLLLIDQKAQSSAPAVATALSPQAGLPTVTVPPTGNTPSAPGSGPSTGLSRLYSPFYSSAQNGSPTKSGAPFTLMPPVAPLPAMPARTSALPVRPPIPLSNPGVARTLVGIVELGEQSAILLEINGVAQRFKLGESIGSTGWTLVEVSKNQAIVRRNGEVRSIFVGQSF